MALNNMSSERVRRGDNLKVRPMNHNNASADNDELQTEPSQLDQPSNEDLAMNDAENEQAQFDEVKDIERKAAEKSPYKGSYTVNVDNVNQSKSKKAEVKSEEQTARQRASKTNSSSWRNRNARYNERETSSKHSKAKESARSSKSSKNSKKQHKPKQPSEVTVQKGESLTKIAEKTGVSVNDLKRANNIDDGNKIKAGEKIKVPTKEEARKAAAAEKKGGKSSKSKKGSSEKTSKSSSKSGSSKSSGKSSGKKSKKK